MAEFFGFEIKRKGQEAEEAKKKSFVAPMEDDGSSYIQAGGGYFGQYVDLDGTSGAKTEADLNKYIDALSKAVSEVEAA